MKITEEETKTIKRSTKFGDVYGQMVSSGDTVYLITVGGTCLEFSCVTGKIEKTKLKAEIKWLYNEEE